MTNSLLFLAAMVVGLIVVSALTGKGRQRKAKRQEPAREPDNYTYTFKSDLFSEAERSFLGVLELAIAENLRVFGKVRVGDLLQPNVPASDR
jgi:hypothetical protein